jgi:hypothetical protein
MKGLSLSLATGLALIVGAAGAVALAPGNAAADTTICDQYGSTTVSGGAYIVQNNRWGTSATQCISVSSTGFKIIQQDGVNPTNGSPTAYPSVYWGCHYGNCTPGFNPIPANSTQFAGIGTSVSMSYPAGGNWDAAYDIWFDPTARRDGQNTGAEIMVWLNHSGPPQPVGSKVATVSLAGASWDVWEGNIGWNVVSYVRTTATGSANFSVNTFYSDAVRRGYASSAWYLTSIQAGFEPWSGGTGLAVNNFAVTTGGSTPTSTPTPTPTTSSAPPPSGSPTCAASLHVTQSWTGGFTADGTVTNTGSVATHSWRVTWTWPSGQQVTNMWNATSSTSGSTQFATDAGFNGAIAAGSSTTFGFQANGNAVAPVASCTAG